MGHQKQSKQGSVQDRVATNGKVLAAEHFEGPLPHPQILQQYDNLVAGSAEAIIKDFQENANSIRELNRLELQATIDRDKRGQYMAFSLGIGILIFASICILRGYPWIAGGALFVAVGAVATAISKIAIKK